MYQSAFIKRVNEINRFYISITYVSPFSRTHFRKTNAFDIEKRWEYSWVCTVSSTKICLRRNHSIFDSKTFDRNHYSPRIRNPLLAHAYAAWEKENALGAAFAKEGKTPSPTYYNSGNLGGCKLCSLNPFEIAHTAITNRLGDNRERSLYLTRKVRCN